LIANRTKNFILCLQIHSQIRIRGTSYLGQNPRAGLFFHDLQGTFRYVCSRKLNSVRPGYYKQYRVACSNASLPPPKTVCFYPDFPGRNVLGPSHHPTHVQALYRRVLGGIGQIGDRNCDKHCTTQVLTAPYPSPILGLCIFLARFLLPLSPQKQVLQPPAQLREPQAWAQPPSAKGCSAV